MEIITLPSEQVESIVELMPELAAHHEQVATALHGIYPVRPYRDQAREAAKMVADGEALVEVVKEDGRMVGYSMASFAGTHGEIDFLYIQPHLRGKGLGKKLAERLIKFLRDNGATMIDLNVVIGNPAKDFYQRLGFVPRSEVMTMKLDS